MWRLIQRLVQGWRKKAPPFSDLFLRFQNILKKDNAAMELVADMGGKMGGEFVFDKKYLIDCAAQLQELLLQSAYDLNFLTGNKHLDVYRTVERLSKELQIELSGRIVARGGGDVYALEEIVEGLEDVVGYKAFNLARILHLPKARVPRGFVVGLNGFRKYLAYNNLFDRVQDLVTECKTGDRSVEDVSHALRLLILGGDIPAEVRREILSAAEKICLTADPESCHFAVRSSAVGEDGELSFAGLHDSFLNVPFRELLSSFKKVLAGLYGESSLEYRVKTRLLPLEMAMCVLYQEMVPASVSGVLQTLDPNRPERPECLVSAAWGLGRTVMEGRGGTDVFLLSRHAPHALLEQRIGAKEFMLGAGEGTTVREVPAGLRDRASLRPEEAALVVEVGLILERYFKRPLEVEWSLDGLGQPWILQAKPLTVSRPQAGRGPRRRSDLTAHPVLLENQGAIAYRGVGAGPVWLVEDPDALGQFPSGAVLVSRFASPWLARAIPRASAVVTDVGSPTGHMATIAREFRVPTIVDTGTATQRLQAGQVVTVDAERNVVYQGQLDELLHHHLLEKPTFEAAYEFQLLRRLLRKIAPLTLLHPEDPNFTAEGCQTFHDVIRFIHEKSIQALALVGQNPRSFLQRGGKRLRSSLPLDLILIDIGGGLSPGPSQGAHVDPDHISSRPMKAIWKGLSEPQTWSTEPVAVDFKGLMSSLTRTEAAELTGPPVSGVNLAVIGQDYVNLSLRVGYHFTVVDAGLGPAPRNNYVYFRFLGGVTDMTRRSRRANLLLCILTKIGFKGEIKGDLVIARASNLTEEQVEADLILVGRLIGFTRQLDVLLKTDAAVDRYCEKFMEANNLT